MKSLIREHIRHQVRKMFEEREYELRQLSPEAFNALGQETLGIPPSVIVDVKIIKAPKPIFKCFLENGQTFNLIDNGFLLLGGVKSFSPFSFDNIDRRIKVDSLGYCEGQNTTNSNDFNNDISVIDLNTKNDTYFK